MIHTFRCGIGFRIHRGIRFPVFAGRAWWLVLAITAVAARGAEKSPVYAVDPWARVMFDFDTPAALSAWHLRDRTRARLVDSPWPGRGKALELTFEPQKNGRRDWPAAICRGDDIPKPPDAPLMRYLLFRVKNVGSSEAFFFLHLRDVRGGRWSSTNAPWTWRLKPGEERRVLYDLKSAFQAIPLAAVYEMHFVTDTPPEEFRLVIDDVALSPGISQRTEAVQDDLRRARRRLARSMPEGAFRTSIRTRLFAFDESLDRIRQASADRPGSPSRTAATVKELEALAEAVRDTVHEIRCEPGKARARRALVAQGIRDDWILGTESSMVKVAWDVLPFQGRFGEPLRLDGAGGEVVHGQIVLLPTATDLTRVTWSVTPLRGPGGRSIPARVRVVGFLHTTKPGRYETPYVGWWPDPLLDHLSRVDVPSRAQLPFWITVTIPRNAEPGEYRGTFEVSPEGRTPRKKTVLLRVRGFSLPAAHHLHLAVNYEERVAARISGKAWNETMKWRYRRFLLDHRFNVDSIYGILPMWDEPTANLKRLRAGGQNFITAAGFNNTNTPGWQAHVQAFAKRAKAAGVENLCWFYGFDESPLALRKDILYHAGACHRLWPAARVMTTATPEFMRDPELRRVIDAWVPSTENYEKYRRDIETVRAEGGQVWYYVCVGPQHPYANLFIEYPAIEARLLLGFMARKSGTDGFLYYSLNRAPKNEHPIVDGPLCAWNPASYDDFNGDGCLFYVGGDGPVSTIRFENMRDGIEDYEAGWLLDDWIKKLAAHSREDAATRELLEKVRRAGRVPDRLIRDLADYSIEPSDLAQYRAALYDALEALAPQVPHGKTVQ